MANLQNHRKPSHTNYMTGLGQKVKHLAEFGAGVKHAYDIAKTVYTIGQTAAPYLLPLLGAL